MEKATLKGMLKNKPDIGRPICFGSCELETKNTAKRNMSSAVCALSIYSRLCVKMSSFLFARMGNAAYIIFIMWNYISGLDTWYHFRFNISCGVAVKVRSHQEKFDINVYREGGKKNLEGRANF